MDKLDLFYDKIIKADVYLKVENINDKENKAFEVKLSIYCKENAKLLKRRNVNGTTAKKTQAKNTPPNHIKILVKCFETLKIIYILVR